MIDAVSVLHHVSRSVAGEFHIAGRCPQTVDPKSRDYAVWRETRWTSETVGFRISSSVEARCPPGSGAWLIEQVPNRAGIALPPGRMVDRWKMTRRCGSNGIRFDFRACRVGRVYFAKGL